MMVDIVLRKAMFVWGVVFLLQGLWPFFKSDKFFSITLFGKPLARGHDLNFLIFSSNVAFEEIFV